MESKQETKARTRQTDKDVGAGKRLKFSDERKFQIALRSRVEEFFRTSSRKQRDNWQMYLKTIIILGLFSASYMLLVFVSKNIWIGMGLAIVLGFSMAGIGFDIQHDAGHGAFSNRPWINKAMAFSLDIIGGTSYIWHFKHAVIHHTYVNITGWDTDINLGSLARVTPYQRRLPFHRWQHLYLWPLYGFLAMKWQFFDDFQYIVTGKLGSHHIIRPKGFKLVAFITGKLVFFSWAILVPLIFHHFLVVLFFYAITVLILGTTLSVVFLLPHEVGQAQFPLPKKDSLTMESSWAEHQARVTLDYAQTTLRLPGFSAGSIIIWSTTCFRQSAMSIIPR
jgi:linoleoyl-CoA desaturase